MGSKGMETTKTDAKNSPYVLVNYVIIINCAYHAFGTFATNVHLYNQTTLALTHMGLTIRPMLRCDSLCNQSLTLAMSVMETLCVSMKM